MKIKKWVVVTTAVCVLLGTSVIAFASKPIKLMINGTEHVTETLPQIINGRVMVPLTTIADAFNKIVSYNEKSKEVNIKDAQDEVIAESEGIRITGKVDEVGIYEHMQIVTKQFSRSLAGYNVTNPSYAPQIISADLHGDGKKEIAVILTKGYGTGVHMGEIHVFEDMGTEILVEDALIAIKKQFNGSVTSKGIEIAINEQHTLIANDKLNQERGNWFDQPGIGSVVRYYVEDNTIKALVSVQISPAEYIGEVVIEYSYKQGIYQAGEAIFIQEEE